MKRILLFLLPLLLVACGNDKQTNTATLVKHSMEVAEEEVSREGGNPNLAVFLLGEIEDDMKEAPDSIRQAYELLKVRAERAQGDASNEQIIKEFTQLVDRWNQRQNELEERNTRNMLIISVSAIVLLLLGGISFYLHRKNKQERRQREEAEEALHEATKQPRKSFPEIMSQLNGRADRAQEASDEDLEQLKQYIYSETPHFIERLEQVTQLTRQEWSILLLSWTDLHQKEIATLTGISQQNLRNIRLRIYQRIKNEPCESSKQFSQLIEELKK